MSTASVGSLPDPRMRGLIVSPPIRISGPQIEMKSSSLDPQEVRCATLLWDKIIWPINTAMVNGPIPGMPGMGLESDRDAESLMSCNFLERPIFNFRVRGDHAQILIATQITAFNEIEKKYPGSWSISQGEHSFNITGQKISHGGALQLELMNAIPVPDKDVPLEEVLKFKEKRFPELQELRQEIDNAIDLVRKAENKFDALDSSKASIDRACHYAVRVGREWQFPIRLGSFKCNFDFKLSDVAVVYAVATGSQFTALSATQQAIGAAALAMIKFSSEAFKWQGFGPRVGPYQYAYKFHDELFRH